MKIRRKAMSRVRLTLLAALLLFLVGSGGFAQKKAKINKAKLIGAWTLVKSEGPAAPEGSFKSELGKDGKVTITRVVDGKTNKWNGTWSLRGDQLTTVLIVKEKKTKLVMTIKELTDTKLVSVLKQGDEVTTSEFKKD
jgi:uncharacterized protein (TIGR03066 family)